MKVFKKWLNAKHTMQDMKAYFQMDVKEIMAKDHTHICMLKAKVLAAQTPDEFTAIRDFAPYIIWVLHDSATCLQRACDQGYDERALNSIAACIVNFYLTVQFLNPPRRMPPELLQLMKKLIMRPLKNDVVGATKSAINTQKNIYVKQTAKPPSHKPSKGQQMPQSVKLQPKT